MRRSTRQYKADLEELADGYQEARDEEFNYQFIDFITREPNGLRLTTEDDLQGFIDSFEFQSEDEWCASEYQSRMESFEDQKMEEERDKRMGL